MKKILTLFNFASLPRNGDRANKTHGLTNLILFFCISAIISLSIAFTSESKIEFINNDIVEIQNTKDDLTDWLIWNNMIRYKSLKHTIELSMFKQEYEGENYGDYSFTHSKLGRYFDNQIQNYIISYEFLLENYPEVLQDNKESEIKYETFTNLTNDPRYYSPNALEFEKFIDEHIQSIKLQNRILQSFIANYIEKLDNKAHTCRGEINALMSFTTNLLLISFTIQIIIYILWQYIEFFILKNNES